MYLAALRLAIVISAIAVALAVTLDAVGTISPARFVAFVAVVGFVSSWMVTGRVVAHTADAG